VEVESDIPGSPTGVTIRARHIINATGVWAEQTERLAGDSPSLEIAPSKGTHLVFAKETFDLGDEAIVLPETEDQRIIFIVPWLSRALVGTTDDAVRNIGIPVATESEIDYILQHVNRFVVRPVSRSDILATFSGYRPLLKLRNARMLSRLSRSHAVVEGEDGLLSISGGKLTTYRRMAQDVMDRIDARQGHRLGHPTTRMQLYGGAGWFDTRAAFLRHAGELGLGAHIAEHLSQAYGTAAAELLNLISYRPELGTRLIADLPYIEAEVVYACRAELALTIEDVLARRTHVALQDRSRGTEIAPRVAELMGEELGWSTADQSRQLLAYQAFAEEQAGPLGLPDHQSA
jgi:glycerol-3-phosphate dehydrogenase